MRKLFTLLRKSRRVRRFVLLGAGILLLILGILRWPWVRATGHLNAARRALSRGDATGALKSLAAAEEIQPERAEVQYWLAVAHRRQGQLDRCELHLGRASQLGWPDEDVQRQRWLVRAQTGDVTRVERPLMEIIHRGASDDVAEEIYEAVARGHLASFRLRHAWSSLDLWLQWRPDAPQARLLRADIYQRLGQLTPAANDYEAVLEQVPEHREARIRLGQLLLRRGQAEEAQRQFRTCLAAAPEDVDALLGLAQCERRLGAAAEARGHVEAAWGRDLTPQQRAALLVERGHLALGDGKPGQAVDALMEAVRLTPADISLHYALAGALAAAGEPELAKYHADRVLHVRSQFERMTELTRRVIESPDDADLRCEAGSILIEQGLESEGAGWLLSALKCDPDHRRAQRLLAAGPHFRKGMEAFGQGDVEGVRAAGAALRGLDVYAPHAHLLQGRVLLRGGRLTQAIAEFGYAKDHPDTRPWACALSGEVLYKAKQFRDAQRILTTAIKLDPANTDARRWLAATYYDVGAMDHALIHLQVVAGQAPADPRPYRLMGLIYKDYENYSRAVVEYRESLRRDPHQPDRAEILTELAECLVKEQKHGEALETLGRCPRSAPTLKLRAECHYAQGDTPGARNLVGEALGLEPAHLGALQLRAMIELDSNDTASAIRTLRQAVEYHPKEFRVRYQLARAYQQLGQTELAQEQVEAMQALRPLRMRFTELHEQAIEDSTDAEIRYELGVVAGELGKPELARLWLTAALGMDPDHEAARQALQAMDTPKSAEQGQP